MSLKADWEPGFDTNFRGLMTLQWSNSSRPLGHDCLEMERLLTCLQKTVQSLSMFCPGHLMDPGRRIYFADPRLELAQHSFLCWVSSIHDGK